MSTARRFRNVAAAGIAFQAGSAAVDGATVMAALIFQLTGSALAVGAVPAILRFGWVFPQIFVGYLAGRGGGSMRYYAIGAFGRSAAIAALALWLWLGARAGWSGPALGAGALVLWAVYALFSGIVGVPYNDIVARAVPSGLRSRLLALRFLGGGLLALGVAAWADGLVRGLAFPVSYAAITATAAALMLVSTAAFVAMGEPAPGTTSRRSGNFVAYLREGVAVLRTDAAFRNFAFAQWCGGAVLMAAPFYVVAAIGAGMGAQNVALLLAAQTAGALASNLLWGWWGDRLGKRSLMQGVALMRALPPLCALALIGLAAGGGQVAAWAAVFALLGALANGLTIAVVGLLMELSPDDRRPAYSGYFNAVTAPAYLMPLIGGVLFAAFGAGPVMLLAAAAAVAQFVFLRRLRGAVAGAGRRLRW